MTPDISPSARPSPSAAQLEIIRKAVNAIDGAGITVSTVPDLGVHCVSTLAPRWEVGERVQVVSPLGAVLLHLQPPIANADAALAHALEANRLWVVGFDDACGGARPTEAFAHGAAVRLYTDGFAAGAEFRALMHRRQGVPVERPADPTTQPMQVETPRALIADLFDTMTVSQLLEAGADSIRARMDRVGPGDQADDLSLYEQTLRELADEARGSGV